MDAGKDIPDASFAIHSGFGTRKVAAEDYDAANAFWEKQGYSLRTNLAYRNKSLNEAIPAGE